VRDRPLRSLHENATLVFDVAFAVFNDVPPSSDTDVSEPVGQLSGECVIQSGERDRTVSEPVGQLSGECVIQSGERDRTVSEPVGQLSGECVIQSGERDRTVSEQAHARRMD
jgi:hypothetical protein